MIIAFFISALIATAVHPMVKALEKKGLPKPLSAGIMLLVIFFAFISLTISGSTHHLTGATESDKSVFSKKSCSISASFLSFKGTIPQLSYIRV